MLEVFFCTAPQSRERQLIADRCYEYWAQHQDVELIVVTPEVVSCDLKDFQRERRVWSDTHAQHPEYVLTDDDMLPTSDDCLVKGITCLRLHPTFGIVSAWPVNCKINRWQPEEEHMRCLVCFGMYRATGCGNCGGSGVFTYTYQPVEDLTVMEHHSVGGLRFCLKGVLSEWPDLTGPGYDQTHSEALRKAGFRVGYSQHARAEHLGESKSETWSHVPVSACGK